MLSDIEIAQKASMKHISEIATDIGISEDELELFGKYKAKLTPALWQRVKDKADGKLILVTAVNPTPAGEGKTTVTVGLGQAMKHIGKKTVICLREPSLGPCMGIKGGAAGGGYSQAIPMEDINLHFTGDIHAVSSANALLAAAIDNHISHGNELAIDVRQIVWKRAVDMNDRALRNVVVGIGGTANGCPREDGFIISVASEVMAVLCLAENYTDLTQRLAKIIVAYTREGKPITAGDLEVAGAMAILLKDAIKPNLVQTLENTPCLMHGGPFANIAHGCNSVQATKLGLKLSDFCITEAGFGADLGAEKFFDIKCRLSGLKPDAVVIVTTVRATKYNGGIARAELTKENLEAMKRGIVNLEKHLENLNKFGVPVVVAINLFATDTEAEVNFIKEKCKSLGVEYGVADVWAHGGEGAKDLAEKIVEVTQSRPADFTPLYDLELPLKDKIEKIATEIYGADFVEFSRNADKAMARIENLGLGKIPVCIAKTQYSFSDDPKKLGRPTGFSISVNDVRVSAGAGFVVVLAGNVMTMPGLPKVPSANNMSIDKDGLISGLF